MSDVKDNKSKATPHRQRLLWLMLVLLTGCALYAGRYFYITQQQFLLRVNLLDKDQRNFASETHEALDGLKLDVSKMQTLDAANTDQEWALHKAQYAIQLAQLNAKWGNDTATTIALLQEADQFLSQHNNAELFPIRQALAHEIAEAQALPALDLPGLLSQLDALQQLISTYTFTQPTLLKIEKNEAENPELPQHTWRDRLKSTLLSFKQFFIIRHHDSPLEPFMSPTFQTAQKEIIRLNLQEAAWAVLEKDDAIYQIALKQAHENIVHAFGAENSKVISLLKQLEQLQAVTLQTKPFVPNDSLPLLEELLHHMPTPTQSGVAP